MNHTYHHSSKRLSTILFLVGAILLLLPMVVFAQEMGAIEGFIYRIATGLGGWALWLAGGLFDYVTITLVIGMGDLIQQGNGLGGTIEQMWGMVRDIFNLLFIFGIIYIGFRVILFSEDSNVHKTLGWLIVAALMINFSLFITQAIVDFSNATSYQIYSRMINSGVVEPSDNTETDGSTTQTRTIGATYMNFMNLTTYAKTAALENTDVEDEDLVGKAAFYGIMMMFLMLIAAFVFAAGAFMFFARFVALILFMILSPAMFVGMIFPFFQQYQKMWWDRFLRYAFVAPAFLFMTYLSIQLLARTGLDPNNANAFADAFTAESWIQGSFMIFLYFFLVIAFFVASLYLAQQIGVYGAGASMKIMRDTGNYLQSNAKRVAGGATFGLAARAGRHTVGQVAQRAADNGRFQQLAARNAGAMAAWQAARGVADSSFDARKIGGLGKAAGIGEGRKGGMTTVLKENAEKKKKAAEALGTSDVSKDEYGNYNNSGVGEQIAAKQAEIEKTSREERDPAATRMKEIVENNVEVRTIAEKRERLKSAKGADRVELEESIKVQLENMGEEDKKELQEMEGLATVVEAANERIRNAQETAEAQVEFAKQIALMNRMEGASKIWKWASPLTAGAGGFGGSKAAGVLGALVSTPAALAVGGGAAVGGSVALSQSYQNDNALKALRKIYGVNGTKMKKTKKSKDNADLVAQALKDLGVGESSS